jgi:nicotinate phosphoribosyltransferase
MSADADIAGTGLRAIDFGRDLLLTDLYQLNMVDAYLGTGTTETAVFEFFVRDLPPKRGFLMAAGLAQLVEFLASARVSEEEIAWLRASGHVTDRLVDYLRGFRFTGDVDAMPEGTVCFGDEPLVRITAPMPEAQLVETRLFNFLQFQTLVATKAARMALAAPGRGLVDFGLRRAHSGESGLLAARAAYLAGFAGTATVPAGQRFGIPLYGTMAHSYVQAHESETGAFLDFARAKPEQTVFLIDTYDTLRGARRVAEIAPTLAAEGIGVRGVRIDSGDLAEGARAVRAILDEAGLDDSRIVASGGLDERKLAALTEAGAPIDVYGVGTSLVVSGDMPALDCAYKLKAYAGVPQRKLSENKSYWPGPLQVWRRRDGSGRIAEDLLAAADEPAPGPGWRALLAPVMRAGAPVAPLPDLETARAHAAEELATVPEACRPLDDARPLEAGVSDRLRALAERVDERVGA